MRDQYGQITADYELTRLQGQEGGTVLFRGQEPSTKKPVWIKILPRLVSDPGISRRFEALAQTIRQLNHPNIASIRAVGRKAGMPYIVTRALEKAQPLAARLDQPWAIDAAADVVMQVGEALDHAYNKGLLHGTLSPNNILVEENGKVSVTDWGVGALLDLLGVQLKQAATPFVAPERTAGQPATARSDVYSLAAILYGLLAKRAPLVVKGEVLPPSRLNPDVPPDMDRVLIQALAPNPADRFANVKAFLAALGAVTLFAESAQGEAVDAGGRCSNCGQPNQTGRFCRKCGARLERRKEPAVAGAGKPRGVPSAQVIPTGISPAEAGREVAAGQPAVTRSTAVARDELAALFPEPLPMPTLDPAGVWAELSRDVGLAMPEPLPMPEVDWAVATPAMPQPPAPQEDPG